MKKISFFLLGVLLLCGCRQADPAQKANQTLESLRQQLNAVGFSVAVVKDNQIIYTQAFGYKSLEDSVPLAPDNLMRIASISKSFTATALMQQYEQGKFSLDDDVSEALGFLLRNPYFPEVPITYRMLLTHTSSLLDTAGYFSLDVVNPQKTADVRGSFHQYRPGSAYDYCNLGFNTIGALVEIHSGERFDSYVKAHILEPLGLYASFNVNDLDAARFATLYEYEDGAFVAQEEAYAPRKEQIAQYVPGYSTPVFSPTGGMKICAADLAKHMLIQMNGGSWNGVTLLAPQSVEAMQTPSHIQPYDNPEAQQLYGFALEQTDKLVQGEHLTGHTGSAYGLASAFFFSPQKHFGLVMMCNGYDATRPVLDNGFEAIRSDVINALYRIFIAPGVQ